MPKKILDVGNCGPDHVALCAFLKRHFDCEVVQVHGRDDALSELEAGGYDLVLINRKLDRDDSDGIAILRDVKATPELAATPVMLLTNYPEHQKAAEAAGALRGFGKLEYDQPDTLIRLQTVLGPMRAGNSVS